MKKIIQHSWGAAIIVVAIIATLSSFAPPGAHSFQVYIDSKMVADQYVTRNMSVPKIAVSPDRSNDIIIQYSECGRTVSGRVITIKDNQDKVLKEMRFDGSTSGFKDPMTLKVKDIAALTSNKGTLKLFYSSNDFKEGQQFAMLMIGEKTTASIK